MALSALQLGGRIDGPHSQHLYPIPDRLRIRFVLGQRPAGESVLPNGLGARRKREMGTRLPERFVGSHLKLNDNHSERPATYERLAPWAKPLPYWPARARTPPSPSLATVRRKRTDKLPRDAGVHRHRALVTADSAACRSAQAIARRVTAD